MEGHRIKVHNMTQLMPESSWYGSDREQPPTSRTSSGRSWLTGHQEPTDGHYTSSSSIMPEVEDINMALSTYGMRQRGVSPNDQDASVFLTEQDHSEDDHGQRHRKGRPESPTRSMLYDREEEMELYDFTPQLGYDDAPVAQPGQQAWDISHMTMDQALKAWGISESFEGNTWRVGLTKQRQARDEITESSKKLTSYELFKLETSRKWKNTKVQLWEMLQMLVVWRGSFKEIEGQYGSSTTSYFSVLRWLMFLNLFVTIVIFGAVVLPQLFFQPATFPKTLDTTTNLTSFQKTAMTCSIIYKNLMDNVTKQQGIADQVLAVVQGTGWMERTVLFAGFYFNKTYQLGEEVKLGGEEERSYNMPLAFLFATAAYFSITLILMILYTGDGMKEQLLSAGEQHNYYFNKIFSAWDCTLMQEKAASQKMLDLLRAFKNDLEQIKEKTRRAKMSTLERAQVYAKRICVNVIVLAFWAGAGYLIYMVVTVWSKQLLEKKIVQTSEVLKLIIDFLPSLTITILNVFIPTLFYMLVKVEDLSPDAEVEFTVARSVVLRLASIIVLVVSLQTKISKCRSEEEDVGSLGCHNCEETRCWETYVGGQFYKLVVMDFFVTLITTIVEFLRRIVAKNLGTETLLGKLVGLNEFDLPKNVLDIVYSQTICWIGAFFCPLIPAITVVKFFLYFYMKKITLLKNYVQSQKAYRASKSNTFFMAILLASFVLCAIVMAYVIGRVQPSVSCGPWRVYSKEEYFMYVSVSDVVSTAPYLWRTILTFLTSSLFYIPMLIFMSLVIYYNVAIASGNKRIIAILKDQLAMEGKDKQFLLQEVRKAMKSGKLAQ